MNRATRIFLVILRLAIGWHLFIEGAIKVESVWTGPTETKRPFTSAPYLRESAGPLAPYFKELAGDLDRQTIERLKLRPLQPADDPERTPPINRFPALLSDEWEVYYQRFVAHYGLDDTQQKKAREVFVRQKDETAKWLHSGVKDVKKPFPSGVVEARLTMPERLAEFEKKLAELQEMLKKELPAFEEAVGKPRLATLKADIARMRGELAADINEQTAKMKAALQGVLSEDHKKQPAVTDADLLSGWQVWTWPRIEIVDWLARWGLVVVGLCLLLGLFTRPACLAGACLLLMFYVSLPPFPGLPENPKAEGNYLFVNKNLIEMLALLVLATTSSGRWLGLDGFFHAIFCRQRPEQGTIASTGSNGN